MLNNKEQHKENKNRSDSKPARLYDFFSDISHIGGTLDIVAIEQRGPIKEKRIREFAALLGEESVNFQDIDLESLKTEDFSDLLESILKRVAQTKSKEKHKMFRDILVNQMISPKINLDSAELYLELISNLTEIEIRILYSFSQVDFDRASIKQNIYNYNRELEKVKDEKNSEYLLRANGYIRSSDPTFRINKLHELIENERSKLDGNTQCNSPEYYNITKDQFLFFKQRLFSKGLLLDAGIGAIGIGPFEHMSITQFGREFMNFICR